MQAMHADIAIWTALQQLIPLTVDLYRRRIFYWVTSHSHRWCSNSRLVPPLEDRETSLCTLYQIYVARRKVVSIDEYRPYSCHRRPHHRNAAPLRSFKTAYNMYMYVCMYVYIYIYIYIYLIKCYYRQFYDEVLFTCAIRVHADGKWSSMVALSHPSLWRWQYMRCLTE